MVAWVFLAGAIATEVLGTLQLRELANGFRVLPAVMVTVSYVASFVLVVPALRTINVGVSYAIWSAVGTAAVAGLGVVLFDERLNALAVVGIVLIVVGVVLLTASGSATHGGARPSGERLARCTPTPPRRTRPRQSAPSLVRTRRSRHRMLPFTWETLRLFLHILAATIWVGGQLTLAALVPTLRAMGAQAPKAAARRFNQVAWPAFGVLVLTGIWNIVAESDKQSHPGYQTTLGIKMALVLLSGVSAFLHTRAKSKSGLAVWGALAALSALGATLFGVLLAS